MKENKLKFGLITLLTVVSLVAVSHGLDRYNASKIPENPPTHTIQGDYNINVTDPKAVVGSGNYVFVGKVTELTGTTYEDKVPLERANGSVEYVGSAYTQYQVKVLTNLKNKLITNKPINLAKQGGLREDKTAYDLFENDTLPQAGKTYLFIAYTQQDGSLLVSGPNSNVLLDDDASKTDSVAKIKTTSVYQKYVRAVAQQTPDPDIEPLVSDYDVSRQ
ncbi:hypothetical protein ACFQHW_08560 [Lapidilactobacillus achengensis]|uniref:Cell surface protein n=1 Tax=Lapidilactobacillus achengensis TaxID=2486000 RepID=A0ABW1UPG5_9LACO|nr:cell surface protein [Lapidilactobacillus achengensis]